MKKNLSLLSPNTLGSRFVWLLLFLSCDLLTKLIINQQLPLHQKITLIPYLLKLTHTFNQGISFGLLQNMQENIRVPLIVGLSVLAIAGFIYVWVRDMNKLSVCSNWGFNLIIAGSLGNLFERIFRGGVTDFLLFHAGSFSFFVNNLADIEISIGVCLLLIGLFQEYRRDMLRKMYGHTH